jgi:hypothetical protein
VAGVLLVLAPGGVDVAAGEGEGELVAKTLGVSAGVSLPASAGAPSSSPRRLPLPRPLAFRPGGTAGPTFEAPALAGEVDAGDGEAVGDESRAGVDVAAR